MTDLSAAYSDITRIAPELNRLSKDAAAEVQYVLMWDGLLWSDELPKSIGALGESSVIGFLVHYRTKLILGSENDEPWPVWEAAKRAFPDWPGFSHERCRYDSELCSRYEQLSRAAWADLDGEDGN